MGECRRWHRSAGQFAGRIRDVNRQQPDTPRPERPHVYSGQKPTPQPSEIRLRTVDGPVHS